MRKIYYIVNFRLPTEKAHGYQIAKMCEAFSDLNIDINLIYPNRKSEINEDFFTYYGVKRSYNINKISFFDFFKLSFLPQKISFYLNALEFVLKAIFLKIPKGSIVYTRNPEIAWSFSMRGYFTFFEAHQLSEKSRIFYRCIKSCNGIAVTTHAMKEDLLLKIKNFPEKKVIICPNGIDPSIFLNKSLTRQMARQELNIDQNIKIVLYTGHLYDWKGADTLALAGNKLPDKIHTYFIGGSDKDRLSYANKYKSENIHFIPFVPRSKVALWLKAADIVVIPNKPINSLSERHTSPIKMFEYMASGTPIIASKLPSIQEILNNKTCSFFTPGDEENLKNTIIELLDDTIKRETLANKAQSEVSLYTWSARAKKISDYLLTL